MIEKTGVIGGLDLPEKAEHTKAEHTREKEKVSLRGLVVCSFVVVRSVENLRATNYVSLLVVVRVTITQATNNIYSYLCNYVSFHWRKNISRLKHVPISLHAEDNSKMSLV